MKRIRSLSGDTDVKQTQYASQTAETFQVQQTAVAQPTAQPVSMPTVNMPASNPVSMPTVTQPSNANAPIVYKSQDENAVAPQTNAVYDYLYQNKWWLILAVAVAYYAFKAED